MQLSPAIDSRSYLARLQKIFREMDLAYDRAAAAYGFRCTGCQDNCCTTRFHHHTLLEVLCLKDGLAALSDDQRRRAIGRAAAVSRQGAPREVMCPLNVGELCIVYTHRPMICRLHGIPHELHRPDGRVVNGPGCDAFSERCGHKGYIPFDRTPYYRGMAALEQALRQETGFNEKIRMTVAQMVLEICGGTGGDDEIL